MSSDPERGIESLYGLCVIPLTIYSLGCEITDGPSNALFPEYYIVRWNYIKFTIIEPVNVLIPEFWIFINKRLNISVKTSFLRKVPHSTQVYTFSIIGP